MTLMEVLIVLIIVAIIAGLAVPSFMRMMEETRSNEARVNLGIIDMGQRIFRANNNGAYWSGNNLTAAAVNAGLNTDLTTNLYPTITITANNGAVPPVYSASLARAAGAPVNWTFSVDQTHTITCAGTNCPCNPCT